MLPWNFLKTIKSPEQRMAWVVAIVADALQVVAFPAFIEGGASPADAVLDVAVAAVLTKLLGWHWAFLPSLMAELVPGLDMFPTWTAAVFFVTRQRVVRSAEPEVLPPGPAPSPRA